MPLLLSGCVGGFEGSVKSLADQASETVGCSAFRDEFWDGLYAFPVNGEPFPTEDAMREAFESSLANGRLQAATRQERRQVSDALAELYRLLALDGVRSLAQTSNAKGQILAALASLEMGDRTTPEKADLQKKITEQLSIIERIVASIPELRTQSCSEGGLEDGKSPSTPQAGSLFDSWRKSRHPAVYGALKSLATIYQSCEAGQLPAITNATPSIEGISIVGTHPNGAGLKRQITDLEALIRSHFYLSSYQKPVGSCHPVTLTPPIYDYGGKPYTDPGDDASLDFFKDAGTGTSELGIDCSGFVYSALAASGLKLKKDGRLKAIGVHGVNSVMLMNPQNNGLTCLAHATFDQTKNIQPGDIIASNGHALIIDTIGPDPFGINQIRTFEECKTANISFAKFDFTILQSSPSKEGIGVNRMKGSDYFAGGGTMSDALITHAVNACMARFTGPMTTRANAGSIIRHQASSDCVDTAVRLEREECVSTCSFEDTVIR